MKFYIFHSLNTTSTFMECKISALSSMFLSVQQ